jgi:hypothetical protein
VREIEEMRYYELTDVVEVLQPIAIGCLTPVYLRHDEKQHPKETSHEWND